MYGGGGIATLTSCSNNSDDNSTRLLVLAAGQNGSTTPTGAYTVTVVLGILNGRVTADKSRANAGDTVTLTATADPGYEFGSWIVKTEDNDPVTVTNNAFTMPAKNVSVSATFNQVQSAESTTFTYTSDFLTTKFYYVKDVQWSSTFSTGDGSISGPDYAIDASGADTTAADWTAGSYVRLTKNSGTKDISAGTWAGNEAKAVPTYKAVLYIGGSESNTKVLGNEVVIYGLDKNLGFMTNNENSNGTFYYTQKGWAASNNGTQAITATMSGCKFPTYEEIVTFLSN